MLEGLKEDIDPTAINHLLADAAAVLGLVCELSGAEALDKLAEWLLAKSVKQARLVVILYPACATKPGDLQGLVRMADASAGRLVVRLHLHRYIEDGPFQTFLIQRPPPQRPALVVGPTPNLGFDEQRADRFALALSAGPDLLAQWSRWFDWFWGSQCVPLRADAIDIPALVRPQGTEEAKRMWEAYRQHCALEGETRVPEVVVDPQTGEVVPNPDNPEAPELLVSKSTGLPDRDRVALRIGELYSRGACASFNRRGRVPPLEVPLSSRFFGEEPEQQHGRVTRQTKYRVKILLEKDADAIEKLRESGGTVLKAMSFQLSTGLRWVPHAVRPLLEKELAHRNLEGSRRLKTLITGGATTYMQSIREAIKNDANTMARDVLGQSGIEPAQLAKIEGEVVRRLEACLHGPLLPELSYLAAEPETAALQESAWASMAQFLSSIVRYPREAAKAGRFFARNFKDVEPQDVIGAMNICGDKYVGPKGKLPDYKEAEEEVERLKELEEVADSSRGLCCALLALLDGRSWEDVWQAMEDARDERAGA